VYYNLNIDSIIEKLSSQESSSVLNFELKVEEIKNLYIVRTDEQKSGYIASERRLNPETLQRAMYWTYQFRIMDSFSVEKPRILLVNDKEEIEGLEGLAKKHGYYIPHHDASLGRRLELLHQFANKKKILIAIVADLPNILKNNDNKLDIFWDSFLLREKNAVLSTEQLNSIEMSINGEDEEYLNYEEENSVKLFDIFKLFSRITMNQTCF
jgi:ATP-dependent DNA helicase RecQ